MQRPALSAVLLCTLIFAAHPPPAITAPNDAPEERNGAFSGSDCEDTRPSDSRLTPSSTLKSTIASIDPLVQRTSMSGYASTAEVSATVEPKSDENQTPTLNPSHYHAFIITPVLSLVIVVLIVILIVVILKSKKVGRWKSRINRSPDKVEADVVRGEQGHMRLRTETIGSREHAQCIVPGPELVSNSVIPAPELVSNSVLPAPELPAENTHRLSVSEDAGFEEILPESPTSQEVLEAEPKDEAADSDGAAVSSPRSESNCQPGTTCVDEADYEAPSGVDSPKPCIYNTILPEPDYELDNEEMSNNYDVPASPGPINRTDSDYECIWSDADDSRPPTPNYEGVYEIPGPRSLPRGVVPGEEYDDIIGPEGRYCAPPTTEQEIYGELKQRNCFTIDRENISILERCGCGQFATVYKGAWCEGSKICEVAVKTLSIDASMEERIKFLQEAHAMAQFCHSNIVQLFGVIAEGKPKMIVMEMMPHGDLRNYLTSLIPPPGKSLSRRIPALLLRFSQDVANGMKYLSLKGYIHRDLAARNILLSADYTCKIADFGLSRDLANDEIYQSRGGLIPLRWTAPEAIKTGAYSTATDVWSYGILLYEIWSLGKRPYGGVDNNEILAMQRRGERLPPPPGCPKPMYTIMIDCWHPEPLERPDFTQIDCFLTRKDEELLWVVPESSEDVHPQARVIGTELVCGRNLYPTLQASYYSTA